ncbi:dihydroorotase [Weissella paramesenteroides]|jgi:dihydroorotase|uniref:dihydroorotase n=1 Tax=Weissella paramesenteroides TaxID=1249 RepID=UPI00112C440B|nr:dihydroorotase [Weissella paramesenteroides]KAA8456971.1 dihydroorotase [Weissella paramesenteroides]KAA8458504.1 dihydroorotase [Weissella paramesenteroides]KAA8460411.1 dihydroorotase [Weissella paramesenteroides]KAA8462806.1 dihydroorotase [Weissella paramesenteroides]KAA8464118.1 dihydroorotase [Weissella paramesenteroides]
MGQLLIKNARHLIHDNELKMQDVLIDDGKIVEIADKVTTPATRTIDAHGALLTPGLVDVHVHFREPGFAYKETVATGSLAAARGGFTTVLAMPNLNPVPATQAAFQQIKANNEANGRVHIYQYAAISEGLTAEDVSDMTALAADGAIAFTNDGKGVQTAATMLTAMQAAAKVNRPLVAHVEDESLVHGGVMNLGKRSRELGLPGIDPLAESSQLARDLVIAKATGVHYHVAHISTKESVNLVRFAKSQGVRVTAEVSPHHLLLDETHITGDNAYFKMNPPLRTPADRAAVIAGLLDGTIDMIATDHAPHSREEKQGSFIGAAFGITGIETSFQLMYTHFVKSGIATLEQLLNWMVVQPSRAFKLPGNHELTIGAPADMALFDIDHEHTVTADEFASKGVNTPFIGTTIYGQTLLTVVDGQIAYEA